MWQSMFALFAQTAPVDVAELPEKVPDIPWFRTWWAILLLLLGVIVVSSVIGKVLARKVRMQDYWWKVALILGTVGCASVVVATGWPPRYGVDLKGGVTLIYEVEDTEEDIDIAALVQALKKRINPGGVKEIIVRPYGEKQVEIIVPDLNPTEVARLKKTLETAGVLKFRIVANNTDHKEVIRLAKEHPEVAREVKNDSGKTVGLWADVALEEKKKVGGYRALKVDVTGHTLRDPRTKKILSPPANIDSKQRLERWLIDNGHVNAQGDPYVQVLMWADDGYDVTGEHLASVANVPDDRGNPSVSFSMTGKGSRLMGGLTGDNLPKDTGHSRRLGILLDNDLLSAPTIQGHITTNGEITGTFTNEEVDFLVNILRAGKLPTTLKKQPLSEAQIDAEIGNEMRDRGIYAIGISLGLVLVFITVYYRFAGVVASFAVLANLVMIVALIMLVKQPFTLTGLAGLVLIVGMSVDANVLIFERIREELSRGSALRMAVRNGFGRATTTIVDANLTTLITALVLYAIGTDQIRGFAVTLILGILMSMFTAIFCARVIFDIGERQRWITKLNMMRVLGETHIDFIGKRRIAAAISILLIVVGLAAVAVRGNGIFAIDLAGGTSVRMVLQEPMETEKVRELMAKRLKDIRINGAAVDLVVNQVDLTAEGFQENTVFKIDTSIPAPDPDEVKKRAPDAPPPPVLADIIQEVFKGKLETYKVIEEGFSVKQVAEAGDAPEEPAPSADEESPAGPADFQDDAPAGPVGPSPTEGSRRDLPADNMLALANVQPSIGPLLVGQPESESSEDADPEAPAEPMEPAAEEAEPAEAAEPSPEPSEPAVETPEPPAGPEPSEPDAPMDDAAPLETPAPETPETPAPADTAPAESEPTDDGPVIATMDLHFEHWIKPETLISEFAAAAEREKVLYLDQETLEREENLKLTILDEVKDDVKGAKKWRAELKVNSRADAKAIFDSVKEHLANTPYFRGESSVGSQIAGDMQVRALAAIIASLIGIIIYLWIRFQRVVFGFAAVVALVHDVLVVLGAVAVSYWLAGTLGFIGIEEFKISLPVVAAFLTIIGYSLNDTIVVFDRIREVRGKSPELTGEMINRSISQTLSRTLLTSFTTFLVVAILYGWGGDAIHGFAFALVVGVIVGTYSSIFVASPALLWMINRSRVAKGKPASP